MNDIEMISEEIQNVKTQINGICMRMHPSTSLPQRAGQLELELHNCAGQLEEVQTRLIEIKNK